MKQLLILVLMLGCGLLFSQKRTAPDTVLLAFKQKYSDVSDVKIKEKKGEYTIRFKNDGHQAEAVYSSMGSWKRTETSLKVKDIPEQVMQTIEKKYKDGTCTSVTRIEKSIREPYYLIMVDSRRAYFTVEIDDSGKVLKSEKVAKEEMPARSNDSGNTDNSEDD